MSSNPPLSPAQRLSSPRCCIQCGTLIRTGSRRPRQFCSDRCRKAHARVNSRTRGVPSVRPGKNNASAAKFAELRQEKTNEINGRILGHSGGPIINLIGGRRTGAAGLDPDLVAKIFAAEIGIPTATVISTDSVIARVTPTPHRNSATPPTRQEIGSGSELSAIASFANCRKWRKR